MPASVMVQSVMETPAVRQTVAEREAAHREFMAASKMIIRAQQGTRHYPDEDIKKNASLYREEFAYPAEMPLIGQVWFAGQIANNAPVGPGTPVAVALASAAEVAAKSIKSVELKEGGA